MVIHKWNIAPHSWNGPFLQYTGMCAEGSHTTPCGSAHVKLWKCTIQKQSVVLGCLPMGPERGRGALMSTECVHLPGWVTVSRTSTQASAFQTLPFRCVQFIGYPVFLKLEVVESHLISRKEFQCSCTVCCEKTETSVYSCQIAFILNSHFTGSHAEATPCYSQRWGISMCFCSWSPAHNSANQLSKSSESQRRLLHFLPDSDF